MNSFKQFIVQVNDWLAYLAFGILFLVTGIVSYVAGAGAAFVTLIAGGIVLLGMFGFWLCISGIYEVQREQLAVMQEIKKRLANVEGK